MKTPPRFYTEAEAAGPLPAKTATEFVKKTGEHLCLRDNSEIVCLDVRQHP